MTALHMLLAAHPLRKKPYNAIRFARVDGNGTPLYTVAKDPREVGAAAALKAAFENFGGHCFHCKEWMPPQPLSHRCTRDHLHPRKEGGTDFLHNLVFACGRCNREKGGSDLITFRADAGIEYMTALNAHLVRCIAKLSEF
ncbi:MAG: HNH endonuclease signature motif containing protein [Sphingomicrobium sp.]